MKYWLLASLAFGTSSCFSMEEDAEQKFKRIAAQIEEEKKNMQNLISERHDITADQIYRFYWMLFPYDTLSGVKKFHKNHSGHDL